MYPKKAAISPKNNNINRGDFLKFQPTKLLY